MSLKRSKVFFLFSFFEDNWKLRVFVVFNVFLSVEKPDVLKLLYWGGASSVVQFKLMIEPSIIVIMAAFRAQQYVHLSLKQMRIDALLIFSSLVC